jgi:hypothetical protein
LNKWEILETAEISPVLSESQFSMNKMPESAVSRFRDRVQAIWFCFPKSRFREASLMITRMSKTLLLAGVALFYTFVVFNNLTDFDSNYEFVRHVLSMDTTLPGNNGLWRALQSPAWHLAFYIGIIAWEIATTVLLWWGFVVLLRTVCLGAREFNMGETSSGDGSHPFAPDVADRISRRGRGVVLDVAVARMEWAGSSLQKLRCRWACLAHCRAAGDRTPAVTNRQP